MMTSSSAAWRAGDAGGELEGAAGCVSCCILAETLQAKHLKSPSIGSGSSRLFVGNVYDV